MFRPTRIVVHHSASIFGDADTIRGWHLMRGYRDIGYHWVILNGYRGSRDRYNPALDGKIEPGRPQDQYGAHCVKDGMNFHALGVCLTGDSTKKRFTAQQIGALIHLLAKRCKELGIPVGRITQHSDHDSRKPFCAGLNMTEIRRKVAEKMQSI